MLWASLKPAGELGIGVGGPALGEGWMAFGSVGELSFRLTGSQALRRLKKLSIVICSGS